MRDLSLREYLRPLTERRKVVVLCLGATVATVMLFCLLSTPQYQATATLQIERHGPDILTFKDVLNMEPSLVAYANFYQTQYKILQSRAVLQAAAERIDLVNRPEYVERKQPPIVRLKKWMSSPLSGEDDLEQSLRGVRFLAKNFTVRPVVNSELVKVSFIDRDATLARDAANAIVGAYQQFSLNARYSTTAHASEFLTKQVAQVQAEIAKKERQLQEYGELKEILAVRDETQDISSQALAELNARLVDAKGRLALAEARYRTVSEAPPEALPEVLNSPLINALKQQYADLERRHGQMSERFRADWPALKQLGEELGQARERLEIEARSIAHQVRSVAGADQEKSRAEVEGLRRRVEEQKIEVRRVNRDAIEYAGLKAEIETRRSFLNDLVNRQSETTVSDRLRDTGASNIRVLDRAETPRFPARPRKMLSFIMSTVMGLMLGVGAALLLDHLDNTVKNEQDIERVADLPVLGHIPLFRPLRVVAEDQKPSESPTHDPVDLGCYSNPRSGFTEAFKNLRTSILMVSPDRPPRHIVVTSCEPGDGKSTLSINLAIVLTELGRKVLFVDADLRRPRSHKMLNIPNTVGLSSYLTGNAGLDALLQDTDVPNLKVITSGPLPPSPSELVGSPSMQAMLDRFSSEGGFDHIILDSPPALQVTDSVILAARADATILVVRAGRTARESLAQGVARLRQARARVAGTVLNAVPEKARYYNYRYYQYYRNENEGEAVGRRRRRTGSA